MKKYMNKEFILELRRNSTAANENKRKVVKLMEEMREHSKTGGWFVSVDNLPAFVESECKAIGFTITRDKAHSTKSIIGWEQAGPQ